MSLLVLLSLACGGYGEIIVPAMGSWTVLGETVDVDDCELTGNGSGMAEGFDIADATQTGFLMGLYDGYEDVGDNQVLDCVLDGAPGQTAVFDCQAWAESDTSDQGGETATLTYTTHYAGTLPEVASMAISIDLDISCEGTLCGQIQEDLDLTFPCTVDVSQEAALDGA